MTLVYQAPRLLLASSIPILLISGLLGEEIILTLISSLPQIIILSILFTRSNIFNNAKDAMPNGGTLKVITINNLKKDEEFLTIKGENPTEFIEIDISDSGRGMEPETLDRIFDPFFSTKEFGCFDWHPLCTFLIYCTRVS